MGNAKRKRLVATRLQHEEDSKDAGTSALRQLALVTSSSNTVDDSASRLSYFTHIIDNDLLHTSAKAMNGAIFVQTMTIFVIFIMSSDSKTSHHADLLISRTI